jgi:hypothetical protein
MHSFSPLIAHRPPGHALGTANLLTNQILCVFVNFGRAEDLRHIYSRSISPYLLGKNAGPCLRAEPGGRWDTMHTALWTPSPHAHERINHKAQ